MKRVRRCISSSLMRPFRDPRLSSQDQFLPCQSATLRPSHIARLKTQTLMSQHSVSIGLCLSETTRARRPCFLPLALRATQAAIDRNLLQAHSTTRRVRQKLWNTHYYLRLAISAEVSAILDKEGLKDTAPTTKSLSKLTHVPCHFCNTRLMQPHWHRSQFRQW